jgi:hypothetical protein
LSEGEKELAKAKKKSERQAKKEQKLKEKEEKTLEYALALSEFEARMNGTALITEQEAYRKEEAARLDNVHASSSIEPTPPHLLGTVASSSTCVSSSTALVARMPELNSERKGSGDHFISLQTAAPTEPTQLLLLGSAASSSNATFARISQGKEEADPNDQVLDQNDFSPLLVIWGRSETRIF